MTDEPLPRDELLDPYLHPYRRYLAQRWRERRVEAEVVLGTAAAPVGLAAALVTGEVEFAILGAVLLLVALAIVARATVRAIAFVWRLSRAWDAPTELGDVRAGRPHAGEVDPELAHEEFAVTVEETGHLVVWRFTPLSVTAPVPPGEVLVPGRPRWSAEIVEERPFEPDATRAAEQLVEVQQHAAELEAQARDAAREQVLESARRRELERETSSTAAALKHLTGQERPDRTQRP